MISQLDEFLEQVYAKRKKNKRSYSSLSVPHGWCCQPMWRMRIFPFGNWLEAAYTYEIQGLGCQTPPFDPLLWYLRGAALQVTFTRWEEAKSWAAGSGCWQSPEWASPLTTSGEEESRWIPWEEPAKLLAGWPIQDKGYNLCPFLSSTWVPRFYCLWSVFFSGMRSLLSSEASQWFPWPDMNRRLFMK